MEEQLKRLMQELGEAINDSLSDSKHIAQAVKSLKEAGYDIYIVLEATIGFNKREEEQPPISHATPTKVTEQDKNFLKALKIDVNDL